MNTYTIGFVGFGKLGRKRAELLQELGALAQGIYYDPAVTEVVGFEAAATPEQIWTNAAVSAVVISTPNAFIAPAVTAALQSGKHVFCEKPPGISLAEARQFATLQEQHPDQVLQFGFNHRHLAHYQELKRLLAEQTYGKPLWLKGTYGKGYDNNFYDQWRSQRALAGGGILIDQGIHLLDLMLDLLGEITVEHAAVDQLKWHQADVEDNVFAVLRSASGIPISFQSSMVHWPHTFELEVGTDSALITIAGVKSSTRSYGNETLRVQKDWRDNLVDVHATTYNQPDFYTLRAELVDWLAAIAGQRPIQHGTVADAVRVMALLENIYHQVPEPAYANR